MKLLCFTFFSFCINNNAIQVKAQGRNLRKEQLLQIDPSPPQQISMKTFTGYVVGYL